MAGHGRTNAEVQTTQTAHSTHADFYKAPLRKVYGDVPTWPMSLTEDLQRWPRHGTTDYLRAGLRPAPCTARKKATTVAEHAKATTISRGWSTPNRYKPTQSQPHAT